MKPIIFLGPTVTYEEAHQELDVVCLPPASQGDVYRAALKRPSAIGIIDGYFDNVPAVWHKEILWAMSQGIHVFGSSSMGALRAAELAPFGMEGIGWIFEAFRDGVLEDDDEVALIHGPAETGYKNLSEPMVNIRRTLVRAVEEKIISPDTRHIMEVIAKDRFYPDRVYPAILSDARDLDVPSTELNAFRAWLPQGRIDQKRLDAIAMLRAMRTFLVNGTQPKHVSYSFYHTDLWEQAIRRAGVLDLEMSGKAMLGDDFLEELRLDVDTYQRMYDAAASRVLLCTESRQQGFEVDEEMLHSTIISFRLERDLLEPADLEAWMNENQLDRELFLLLMMEEARLRSARVHLVDRMGSALTSQLRVSGQYRRIVERARDKRTLLAVSDAAEPNPEDIGMDDRKLMEWFSERWPGQVFPDDMARTAQKLGFEDAEQLLRALRRERLYFLRRQ